MFEYMLNIEKKTLTSSVAMFLSNLINGQLEKKRMKMTDSSFS